MSITRRLKKGLKDPALFVLYLNSKKLLNWMSDEAFIKLLYKCRFGCDLNLDNPRTFNEKIQFLKLKGFKDEYTDLVDKISVRKIVSERIGEKYLVPIVGGPWNSTSDINISLLPEQFVFKCNHDCGSVIVCRDKNTFDFDNAFKKLDKCIKRNYYEQSRERPYKSIKPRIFAEQFISNKDENELVVYKFFNFNGKPRIIQTIQGDKTEKETIDYFDTEWKLLDLRQNFPNSKVPKSKPIHLDEMIQLSEKLSYGFPFIRVDFYDTADGVKFSEFTLYTDAGIEKFHPEKWDTILGEWIKLG